MIVRLLLARYAVLALGAAMLGWAAAAASPSFSFGSEAAGVAVFTALCAVPFVLVARRREIDLAEPIYVVAVIYLFTFPLRALYVRAHPEALTHLGPWGYEDYLDAALVAGAVGFATLLVGYYCGLGPALAKRLPRLPGSFAREGLLARSWIVVGVGLAAWLYLLIVVGRVHGLDDAFTYSAGEGIVEQLANFSLYGVSLVAIWAFRRRQHLAARLVLVLVASLPTWYVAFTFVKRYVLVAAVFALLMAWHYRRRRLRPREAAIGTLLVLAVIFPVLGQARADLRVGEERGLTEAVARAQHSLSRLGEDGVGGYAHHNVQIVMERMHGVDALAGVLKRTPEVREYQLGREFALAVPAAIVPRAVWPEKPRFELAQEFGSTYFGSTDRQTHVAVFNLADLYLNFWWVGIVVGGFALGVAYRAAHSYLIECTRASEVGVFLYTFVFLYIVSVEWQAVAILFLLLRALPALLAIVWFLRLRTNERGYAAAPAGGA